MAPPPPELPPELVVEIFLRLPPDEPRCLFRASLVSKFWLRRLALPAFRRRYCELHRTPPMLGFLTSYTDENYDNLCSTHFVPTVKLRPTGRGRMYLRALDARHGRVLFQTNPTDDCALPELIVWDPSTLQQRVIRVNGRSAGIWTAVLCAQEGCDHLDCHGHPFLVAYVSVQRLRISARLYASQTASWSDKTYVRHHDQDLAQWCHQDGSPPNVLVGNTLYFNCCSYPMILRYGLADRELSVIKKPKGHNCIVEHQLVVENGLLGLAAIVESSIHLWWREVDEHGAAAWVQPRVIKLLLPPRSLSTQFMMCGFAERVGVIFLSTEEDGIFTVELKSGRAMNLCSKGNIGDPLIPSFFDKTDVPRPNYLIPYMSFYTPGRDMKLLPPGPSAFSEL